MKTCIDHGEKHTWERRGHSGGGPLERTGCFVFECSSCSAWGWAPTSMPEAIRQYEVDTFRSREPALAEEAITAIPSAWHKEQQAKAAVDLDVDRRGPPRPKRAKGQYRPRFTIEDWDRG
ncbi:MAG TPA: hypothetical protein VIF09_07615 [Polyangiaceae bacterium]|jgi:hypothetical protein